MKSVIIYLILSYLLFFILLQPFQTPDEQGHYETAYWMSRGIVPWVNEDFSPSPNPYGAFIGKYFNFGNDDDMLVINPDYLKQYGTHLQKEIDPDSLDTFLSYSSQAYNPPFYYLLAGLALALGRVFSLALIEQFYLGRLVNGLLYGAVLVLVYLLLKQTRYTSKTLLSIVLIIGLNPLFLQTGIGMGPDMAFTMMTYLFLYLLVLWKKNVASGRLWVLVGISLGLAIVTKITGIVFVVVFISSALVMLHNKRSNSLQKMGLALIIALGVSFLIVFPWIGLNLLRYGKPVLEGIALGLPKVETGSVVEALLQALLGFRHTIMHYSGFLGWNDVHPFPIVFWSYTAVFSLSIVFGVPTVLKEFKGLSVELMTLLIGSILFFGVFSFLRTFYFNAGWGIGGRNILYIFPLFVISSVAGVSKLSGWGMEKTAVRLAFFSICYFYFMIIFVLVPRYYV